MIGSPKAPADTTVDTGMRRICWVRITLDQQGVQCEVLGVGHRRPLTRRVSLDTALALAARGVPTVVRSPERDGQSLLTTG